MAEKHPGISMHKLPIGAGFIGLVFTVGCALIFLLGLPQLWYFVVFSTAFGVVLAAIFRVISRSRAERMKPLSILQVSEQNSSSKSEAVRRTLFRALAMPRSA
jgi:uncharacterized membrane protein